MIKSLWSAKRAFALTWEHKSTALKICLGFTMALAVIFIIEDNLTESYIVLSIGEFITEALLAFMWHRVVLLNNDNYAWFGIDKSIEKEDMLHINDGMTKFIWTSVGFTIVGGVVFLIILFVSNMIAIVSSNDIEADAPFLGMVLTSVIMLLFSPIIFRLALVFPAISIGHSAEKLKVAWSSTEGQSLRIIGSYLIVASVWVVMGVGFSLLPSLNLLLPEVGLYTSIVENFLAAIFVLYATMVWAGLNSTLFMQLHDDNKDYLVLDGINSVRDRVYGRSKDSH